MTEWGTTTKIEIINYLSKITTPRKAQAFLRLCLDRIDVLERANASFGDSMERFADNLPDMLQAELDRRTNPAPLQARVPDELEAPEYEIVEKGGKQPPNPPNKARASEFPPLPPHHT